MISSSSIDVAECAGDDLQYIQDEESGYLNHFTVNNPNPTELPGPPSRSQRGHFEQVRQSTTSIEYLDILSRGGRLLGRFARSPFEAFVRTFQDTLVRNDGRLSGDTD